MSDRFDGRKVPVDAVVAVVVTVLTVLSVGVVGVDAVDCDSVVKVVGVVALSEKITRHILIVGKGAFHMNYISSKSINHSINNAIHGLMHITDIEIIVSE